MLSRADIIATMTIPGPSPVLTPVHIAIMTVSDTRSLDTDASGATLAERATTAGHIVVRRDVIRDDVEAIVARLRTWLTDSQIDVIITTGGTGITGRDVTPEAFKIVCEKDLPGFGELFRWLSYSSIGAATMQSRATAGVAKGKYLFALPGSPGACRDGWDKILVSQLDSRTRPCNLVGLMPRLQEGAPTCAPADGT